MNSLTEVIISGLLSVISLLGGFALWYVVSIFNKTEKLDEQIKRNNAKITSLREHLNENISKIYSSQQGIGTDLVKLRGAVVSGTVVLRRRKSEIAQVMEDGKRTQNRVETINRELEKHKKVLVQHDSDIVMLKGGNILVKGNKDE